MNATADRLIEEYLEALRRAAASLPPDQRDDLVGGIEEHIAEARRMGVTSEADVRTLLDRLGRPAAIVAESAPAVPPPPAATVKPPGRVEFAAIACLILAEFTVLTILLIPLALVFWIAGLVCLFISGAWTTRQKVRALAILGSGFILASVVLGLTFVATGTTSSVCNAPTTTAERASPPADGGQGPQQSPPSADKTSGPVGDCTDRGTTSGSSAFLVGFGAVVVLYLVSQAMTVRALLRPRPPVGLRADTAPSGASSP
jgi:uncharacterized membrane protein